MKNIIKMKHDWLLLLGAGITLLLAVVTAVSSGVATIAPFLTGWLVSFVVSFGIVRAIGQRGLEKREQESEEAKEHMKRMLGELMGKKGGGSLNRVRMELDDIQKSVREYIQEGESRSEKERQGSKLLVHRGDCDTPWEEEDCDCDPLIMEYDEVSTRGANEVAKQIYATMRAGMDEEQIGLN